MALWRATRKILSSSKALGVPMYQIHSLAVFAGRILKSSQSGETMPSVGEYHSEREKRSVRQSWEVHVKKYNVCLKKKRHQDKKKTSTKRFFTDFYQAEKISKLKVKVYFKYVFCLSMSFGKDCENSTSSKTVILSRPEEQKV